MATRGTVAVVAAFAVALAIRLVITAGFQGLTAPPNLGANPDQAEYEQIAFNLSHGHGYSVNGTVPTAVRPPGFALTLWPVYTVFGRSFTAARITIIVLSALTCVFAGWIGYAIGGWWCATIAAWWLALYPGHFYYAMHFLSEPIFAFWLAAALALTIAAFQLDRPIVNVLAGACWGMAILTRVELVVVVPIACALVMFERREERRARARQWIVQAIVIAAMLAPWVIRNGVVMHEYTLSTQGGCTFWGAHNELTFGQSQYAGTWVDCSRLVDAAHPMMGAEIARNHLTMSYGVASVRAHVRELPSLEAMKVWRLLSPYFETTNRIMLVVQAAGWILTAPFFVFGVWILARSSTRRSLALVLMAPLLATLVTTVLFYGSPRYRDAAAPVLVVVAAVGLRYLITSTLAKFQRSLVGAVSFS